MTHVRFLTLGLLVGLVLGASSGCNVTPCTPQNCNGCCDDYQVCRAGNESAACGLAGSACIDCGGDVCNANGTCFGTYSPGPRDAGLDDLLPDANFVDAGFTEVDAGVDDAGLDAGPEDAGFDAGVEDAGHDAGLEDAGLDAGAEVDAGVDAGEPDAGVDAGLPDAGPTGRYVSPTGDDANPGTRAAPFLTLGKAASVAQAGEVIVALDGLYDSTTQPAFTLYNAQGVRVPDGVSLIAENPGFVTFQGRSGMGIDFLGSGAISGIRLDGFSIAVRFTRGLGAIVGVDFAGCGIGGGGGQSCVEVHGDAGVTMEPAFRTDYFFAPGYALAGTYGQGQLVVRGGRLTLARDTGVSGNSALRATESSRLLVEDFTLSSSTTPIGFAATGGAKLDLVRVHVADGGPSRWGVAAYHGSTVTLQDCTVEGYGVSVCVPPNTGSTSRVIIRGSTLAPLGSGVYSGYGTSPRVELYDSRIVDAGQYGISLDGDYPASTLLVHRSEIAGSFLQGIQLSNGATPYRFELRGSRVHRSGQTGVYLGGSAAAVFDLGTASDAGFNVLRDNAVTGYAGTANLRFLGPGTQVVPAVGNEWQPNVQGADGMGRFTSTDGGPFELVGPRSGGNVWIDVSGARVRVAE
jgi:hypothetical protein